jgi:hypothetical protein
MEGKRQPVPIAGFGCLRREKASRKEWIAGVNIDENLVDRQFLSPP